MADDKKQKDDQPQTGSIQKETLPPIDAGYKEKYWDDYGKEMEIEKEIRELGIEKFENGTVKLSDELAKEIGAQPTVNADTSFHEATGFKIAGLSLTDDKLSAGKSAPVTKSFRWLVEWFIYELLKAHFLVSFVKGKIQRKHLTS